MKKIRKAVIPVAGFGTRFLPATKSMPKEMLPIIDKPVIHFVVEEAINSGIEQIIFITGRGKRAIEDYFDHSYELEDQLRQKGKLDLLKQVEEISDLADIVYIRQKEPLGLGHAVLRARDIVGNEPFAVLLPDILIDNKEYPCTKKLIDIYEKTGKSVLSVKEIDWEKVDQYGIVDPASKGNVFALKDVIEKPSREEAPSNLHIVGRYVFTPKIFEFLLETKPGKGGEIQITDAIREIVKDEGAMGSILKDTYYDTGDKLGFLMATVNYALRHDSVGDEFKNYLKKIVNLNNLS